MTTKRAVVLLVTCVFLDGGADHARAQTSAAPTPLSPADGQAVDIPVRISWTSTLDPNLINGGYNWQVGKSSSFAPLVMADSTNPATTEDFVSGLPSGTYFWRVQAVSGAGPSAWSQAQSFVVVGVGPGTPGTPVLNPTQGYSTFHPWESIHFTWSDVPDAVTYRLEVSNDPEFPVGQLPPGTITFHNDNIPTTHDGYVHTMIGNWFARVFAVNADNPQEGIRSLPSNVIQFSVFYDNPIGPPPELLSPLDNPTLKLPVTLTWAHVPNPQSSGYLWEVATDPGFNDIEAFNNQYTNPMAVMLSLTSGPKYWRVLSQHGMSSPTTVAVTDWSATGRFTISSDPATPVSIGPTGNSGLMYSGATTNLALQLTAGVPANGATVALSSSHPSLVPLPSTFSVLGGHAYAEFLVKAGQVTTPTAVTLTATLNGVSASSVLTVRPPTLNDQFIHPTVRTTGGSPLHAWVSLEGGGLSGPSGFVVNLSSSSSIATPPSTVTIPAGVNGTGFQIQTSPVSATTVVTMTASGGGVTSSWPVTITPSPPPANLIVRPMSTTNGSQGIVTVNEGLGQDQTLQVSSSNSALAAVPNTVSVSAGSGVGFFNITTAAVTAPVQVTISVTGGGVTLTHPLTLYPTLPAMSSLTVSPSSVAGGSSATGTLTLASPAPVVGVHVNLGAGVTSVHVPRSVFIAGGATSATFLIETDQINFTNSVQISAAMNGEFESSSVTVTPTAPSVAFSAVTVNPTSVVGGNSSTGTVTLSAAAPSGGAVVSLSDNSSATTVPSSVTVPAGASSANFTVTTGTVTATTTATITGSFGGTTRTVSLTVNPATSTPTAPRLLSPANRATVSQPVTLDWSDVANAATYTLQVDTSSNFTTPLTYTASVSVSQATVSGLPATQLFWRVRGVNAAGTAGPFSSSRRFTAQSTTTTAALASVAVTPTSVVGGSNATGTVTLTSAAPTGGLAVALSSSNTAASVPASVTVASGATTASFAIATNTVTASPSVTITATQGSTTRTATLTVTPEPPAASLSALSVSPSSVTGGSNATGTVTLTSAAPTGGLAMTLSSSNAAASVPASVTVAAGATTASFAITTNTVTASTSVTITATQGSTTRTTTLTVTPLPPPASLSALSVSPSSVTGGSNATGTVTLTSGAPSGGLVVTLSSSNAAASVPASVTVASGATSAQFTISTVSVTTATTVTITGTSNGVTRTATLTVNQQSTTLAAPTLVSPASDARFSPGQTITFDWGNVAGASTYTIQIDDTENLSSPLVNQTVSASQFATNTLPTTRMWFRVRANDASGNPGAWSAVRRFEVKD